MPFITEGKTNLKYLLIVAVVAVLAGGGILGYLNWWAKEMGKLAEVPEINKPEKVEDETAELVPSEVEGWKTYRNEEYGFEVRYPEKLEVREDFIFTSWGHVGFSCDTLIQCEESLVFNEIQYKGSDLGFLRNLGEGKEIYAVVFLQKNTPLGDGMGEIKFSPVAELSPVSEFKKLADQILSTFRFLE